MSQHKFISHYGGWRPARPDHRLRRADTSGLTILSEVDPRPNMPDVFNQYALGACTIHADIGAFMYDAICDGDAPAMLCRLQGYWCERQKEGSLGQGDTGAKGSDGFWVAQNVGLAAETDWPYVWQGQEQMQAPADSVFDPVALPANVLADEAHYRLTKPYAQPPTSQQAFQAVFSNHQTISFGFTVYESFESSEMASTGIMPMPGQGEQILGGHQVLAVGYLKAEPNYVLVRNSWGSAKDGSPWGLDGSGYFLMPWQFILDPNYCSDWRTIQRVAGR